MSLAKIKWSSENANGKADSLLVQERYRENLEKLKFCIIGKLVLIKSIK